jgi:hypothetical protein
MPRLLSTLLAVLAFALLSACSSFASRAKEKAAVFSALDPTTRTRLEAREIQVGDTADMVYIALGKPDEKQEKITAAGVSGVWVYSAYWEEYQGTRLVGYRRDVVYNAGTKSYQVFYTPDYQPVYAPRIEDRLRVTFEAGRVTVVEKAQPDAKPPGGAVR